MINTTATNADGVVDRISQRAFALSEEGFQWLSGNLGGILIAAVIGTAIALALIGLRSIAHRRVQQGSDNLHWRTIFARAIARTGIFFIVLCAAEIVAEHANTPAALLSVIHVLFVIAAAFQAAIWAREIILGWVEYRVGPEAESSTLGSATGIIRLLVSVALFAIAIVLILDNLGVNVTGLIAGLGIGGIAIGLAAQGIFADLFAALSIIFDKPFRKGDTIRFEGNNGTVEKIGLKTTRIRSITGELIVVSNTNLLNKQLHNFANLSRRRMTLTFGLVCQTPPEVLKALPDRVRALFEGRKRVEVIRCGMIGFGASSLDYELVFDVRSTDFEQAFAMRNDLCIAILAAFDEAGIALAYPAQTSFTAAPDGTLIMPYSPGDDGPEPLGESSGPSPAKARHKGPPPREL